MHVNFVAHEASTLRFGIYTTPDHLLPLPTVTLLQCSCFSVVIVCYGVESSSTFRVHKINGALCSRSVTFFFAHAHCMVLVLGSSTRSPIKNSLSVVRPSAICRRLQYAHYDLHSPDFGTGDVVRDCARCSDKLAAASLAPARPENPGTEAPSGTQGHSATGKLGTLGSRRPVPQMHALGQRIRAHIQVKGHSRSKKGFVCLFSLYL